MRPLPFPFLCFRAWSTLVLALTISGGSPLLRGVVVVGAGSAISENVLMPDGTIADFVLMTGATVTVSADPGQAVRVQFIDPSDDIVTIQLSGNGACTVALGSASGPELPANYNQFVNYMRGQATVTVTAPDSSTELRIWTIGRGNAANQALFRDGVSYDGIADLTSIRVAAASGATFGLLDATNVRFSGTAGSVGISAADVHFSNPVSFHDISAAGSAVPTLVFGSVSEVRVLGGDLAQPNGQRVIAEGFPLLTSVAGSDSHNVGLPAQAIAGVLSLSRTFAVGQAGSVAIPHIGSANTTFAIESGTLPRWATLDPTTGIFSGTPTSTFRSPFTFVATVAAPGSTARVELRLIVSGPPAVGPSFTLHPTSSDVAVGEMITLSAVATGTPAPSYQWHRNGLPIADATASTLELANATPETAGLYTVVATNDVKSVESLAALIGVRADEKVAGIAEELASGIVHQNLNIYDQVLLKGAYASIKADAGEITRLSFTDPNHDIIQVEFAGAGTLSIWLEDSTPPAAPINYNQGVNYVGGHARIVVTGANESTNLSVFTVGRVTAVNPALFRDEVNYDGFADIISISISSTDGKFGGLRTANAAYIGTEGVIGVFAPNVTFTGPVFVGDIAASDTGAPTLIVGSANDVRVTGGDLLQPNDRAVAIKGVNVLQFRTGSDSHGSLYTAQANRARLEQDGVDVTAQVAQPPQP